MARTKIPTVKGSRSPSPPRRMVTRKTISKPPKSSKHFRPKVLDKGPRPPAAKGVVIQEPIQTRSKTKETPTGKGKKVATTPEPSSSDSPPRRPMREADLQAALYEAALAQFLAKRDKQGSSSTFRSQREPASTVPLSQSPSASRPASTIPHSSPLPSQTTQMPSQGTQFREEDLDIPPGFNSSPLSITDQARFDFEFSRKTFCLVVSVDLMFLLETYNIDLVPFLEYYDPWLSVNLPYCALIVKQFYCNMENGAVTDHRGVVVEDGIRTSVRGQTVVLCPSLINHYLGYDQPPNTPYRNFTLGEIHQLLLPNKSYGRLPDKPSQLPDIHRVLFYIYSRAMVNKAKNFTHLTERDHLMMASIIAQERRNVGQMIYDEIDRFRFHSSLASPIPYPQLVSLFLQKNHIWYLEPSEPVCKIAPFGKIHLNRMKIDLSQGGPRTQKPQKKKMRKPDVSRPEHMDEAQSSFKSPSSPPPSFMGTIIQGYIEEGFKKVVEDLREREDKRMRALVSTMGETFDKMASAQERTNQEVSSLRKEVAYLQEIVLAHISSQIPSPPSPSSPTPSPAASPVHCPSPTPSLAASPVHCPSPTESGHSIHTEVLSTPESIHQIISPGLHSAPPTEKLPSPSDDPATLSADDKKGEKSPDQD